MPTFPGEKQFQHQLQNLEMTEVLILLEMWSTPSSFPDLQSLKIPTPSQLTKNLSNSWSTTYGLIYVTEAFGNPSTKMKYVC